MVAGSHAWGATRGTRLGKRDGFRSNRDAPGDSIVAAFEKFGKVVPVFNDKPLGPEWPDALWMYQRAQQLRIPFMAGSSMPVGFRVPDRTLPMGSDLESVVGIGYSGLDIYGSHAPELLQCLVERRRGAETGVAWVQCLQGDALWRHFDSEDFRRDLLDAALAITPHTADADIRRCAEATLFRFRYRDGLPAAVLMLPGFSKAPRWRCGFVAKPNRSPSASMNVPSPDTPILPTY